MTSIFADCNVWFSTSVQHKSDVSQGIVALVHIDFLYSLLFLQKRNEIRGIVHMPFSNDCVGNELCVNIHSNVQFQPFSEFSYLSDSLRVVV